MDLRRLALVLVAAGIAPIVGAACSSVESSHPGPIADQPGSGGSPTVPHNDAGVDGADAAPMDATADGDYDASGITFGDSPCGKCFLDHCATEWTACQTDPGCQAYYKCELGCMLKGFKTPGLQCPACSDKNKSMILQTMEFCQGSALALSGPCDSECN
jgi:hypothetical protein